VTPSTNSAVGAAAFCRNTPVVDRMGRWKMTARPTASPADGRHDSAGSMRSAASTTRRAADARMGRCRRQLDSSGRIVNRKCCRRRRSMPSAVAAAGPSTERQGRAQVPNCRRRQRGRERRFAQRHASHETPHAHGHEPNAIHGSQSCRNQEWRIVSVPQMAVFDMIRNSSAGRDRRSRKKFHQARPASSGASPSPCRRE